MKGADTPLREPHPVRDPAIAAVTHQRICGARGYCGPFINVAFYAAFPDPIWHGMGDCILCGNSCRVETEQAKQRRAERERRVAS